MSQEFDIEVAARPTAEPKLADIGVLSEVVGYRFRRLYSHFATRCVERIGREIRPGEFSVLAIIAANPGISQIDVAREIGQDRASVVSMMDDLERWGCASRQRSSLDRRRHELHITPQGREMLGTYLRTVQAAERLSLDVLSDTEQMQFMDMLRRLYDAARSQPS